MVADQDTDNLRRTRRGLKASRKPGVALARYKESRIRHFHETLDARPRAGAGQATRTCSRCQWVPR